MQSTSDQRQPRHDSSAAAPETFPPLDAVNSPTVDTAAAAYYTNRKAQTLRGWACMENGPIRPLRVHGRLAWPVADIRKVMGVSQ